MPSQQYYENNSQIPRLKGIQFDPNGEMVNLFRGITSFQMQLISLPGLNGLTFSCSLLYDGSDVPYNVDTWNLDAPTDIVGNGWALPYERIVVSNKQNGSQDSDRYYLIIDGQPAALLPLSQNWIYGVINFQTNLIEKNPNPSLLIEALKNQLQLQISFNTRLVPKTKSNWLLLDDDHEMTYTIKVLSDHAFELSAGGYAYELEGYRFWNILYYPEYERWEITKEDGHKYSYGGKNYSSKEDPHVLQWGIKWDNWIGPSAQASSQQRYIKAWNLAKVYNVNGNYYSFEYTVQEQGVGDGELLYTKESHVSRVYNDLGWSVKYDYAPKLYDISSLEAPKEYIDPHLDPTQKPSLTSNAYQDSYDTLFLSHLTVFNEEHAIQSYICFEYHPLTNLAQEDPSNLLGYGALYKRYLKSITQYTAEGYSKPNIQFDYYFTKDPNSPRGLLKEILTPLGGKTSFNYQLIEVGTDSKSSPGARNLTIENPFGSHIESNVRTWYGPDYIVCGWYDDTQSTLKLNVYTWLGRWYQSWDEWITFPASVDLTRIQIATTQNTFLLTITPPTLAQSEAYLFHRKPLCNANWILDTDITNPIRYSTATLQLCQGDLFFLVLDDENKKIDRFTWDERNKKWDYFTHTGKSTYNYYIAAQSNYYIITEYNLDSEITIFSLYYQDSMRQWQHGGKKETDQIKISYFNNFSYMSMVPSSSFLAMAYITGYTPSPSNPNNFIAFDYAMQILTWDENYQNLSFSNLTFNEDNFKNIPYAVTNSLGPQVINNCLVGAGPNIFRFDGIIWHYKSIGIQYPILSNLPHQYYWYAYNDHAILKTENTDSGIYSELLSMDPSQPEKDWVDLILQDISPPPQNRYSLAYPTITNSYVSQDSKLFNPSVNLDWHNFLKTLIADLSEEQIDTTTIINQAPHFVAFMTLNEQGEPKETCVLLLKNGTCLKDINGKPLIHRFKGEQMFQFLDRQHYYKQALNGRLPAIPLGFVTYPYISTLSDQTTAVTLHRYSADDVIGPIKSHVVASINVDTIYNQHHKCYQYEDITAAADSAQGTILRFQTVTEYDGCKEPSEQQYGYTTSTFYNGLPYIGLQEETMSDSYSIFDGFLIDKKIYNSQGHIVSGVSTQWIVATQIAANPEKSEWRNLYGGIPFVQSTLQTKDGVETQTNYSYKYDSGNIESIITQYYGSQGTLIQEKTSTTYAYEKYPAIWSQHILPLTAENYQWTLNEDNKVWQLQSYDVQTYKLWTCDGKNIWGNDATYKATQVNAPAFTWWVSGTPTTEWLCSNQVIQRGAQGNVLLSLDVKKIPTCHIYDVKDIFLLASFHNASFEDGVIYNSFESYQSNDWNCIPKNAGKVTSTDKFSGKNCFELNQSGTLTKTIPIISSHEWFSFNAWVKTPYHVGLDNPNVQFFIQNKTSTITYDIKPTNGQWVPIQWVIDLSQLLAENSEITLGIKFQSQGAEDYLHIDNILFFPVKSLSQATVYDLSTLSTTADLTVNTNSHKVIFDPWNVKVGEVGPYGNPLYINMTFNSRQLLKKKTSRTSKFIPNGCLSVHGRKQGFYETFTADAFNQYEFVQSTEKDWSIDDGILTLVNNSSHPLGAQIQRKNFSTDSLAIYVQVQGGREKTACIGSENYFSQWNGDKSQWELYQKINNTFQLIDQSKLIDWQPEWFLIIFGSRLLFYAGGACVFNIYSDAIATNSHKAVIGGKTAGTSFTQFTVLEDIQYKIDYLDGLGSCQQSLIAESDHSVILSAFLYDILGHRAITVTPSRVTIQEVSNPFSFYEGFITNGNLDSDLWKGLPMTGPVVDIYNPKDEGYPFSRTIYEPSPLSRPLHVGSPGKDFAIWYDQHGILNPHTSTYSYGKNDGLEQFLYPLPPGQYLTTTHIDPDGIETIEYQDLKEHTIGTITRSPQHISPQKIVKASYIYDDVGYPIATISPTHYQLSQDLQSGVIPTDAIILTYDFLAHVIKTKHPDQGEVEFIYDKANNLRFMREERGKTKGYFNYFKYDKLGRVIEKGIYTHPWDRKDLETFANLSNWPTDQYTWSNRFIFDGQGQTPYMLGRLWQSQANNNASTEGDVQIIYAYDCQGFLTSLQQIMKTSETTYKDEITYTYSLPGKCLSSYDSLSQLTLKYNYNLLDQLENVQGKVENELISLANYSYNPQGHLDNTSLMPKHNAFTRSYDYLPNEWLQSIGDSSLQETLKYIEGSCANSGYYNGSLAGHTISYKSLNITSDNCFINDALNRLVETRRTNGAVQKWQLDDNGNILEHHINEDIYKYDILPNTNKLMKITSPAEGGLEQQFQYDEAGDIIGIFKNGSPSLSIQYTKWNGLPYLVKSEEKQDVSYLYSPDNIRLCKRVIGKEGMISQTRYLLGNDGKKVTEIDSSGLVKRIVGLPGVTLIYLAQKKEFYWVLTDYLGSTRAIIDKDHNPVALYDYDVYGSPTVLLSPPFEWDSLFTGQVYDQEINLYNFHARFYDPSIGRFLMIDPALQGFNPYSYVNNRPHHFIDPSGEIFGIDDFLIGLAVSVIIGAAIGAATGGIQYAITKEGSLGMSMGLGALAGAVGGAAGFGVGTGITTGIAWAGIYAGQGSAVVGGLVGFATGAASGAVGGVTGQLAANGAAGQSAGNGLGQAAWIGAAMGGVMGGITGARSTFKYYNTELNGKNSIQTFGRKMVGPFRQGATAEERASLTEMVEPNRLNTMDHATPGWKRIGASIRDPGGEHEWLAVEHTARWRAMDFSIQDIQSMRSPTATTEFNLPVRGWVAHNRTGGHPQYNALIGGAESEIGLRTRINTYAAANVRSTAGGGAPVQGVAALPSALRGSLPPIGRLLRMPFSIAFGGKGRAWL